GGIVLIAAGIYQWTPLKEVCLVQCQSPFHFLMRHGGFRSDAPGCVLLGLRHGGYCIGCCWVLMALLFVGGVMNVLWIALLALLVLMEKVTPIGRWIARAAGAACVAAGIWMLLSLSPSAAGSMIPRGERAANDHYCLLEAVREPAALRCGPGEPCSVPMT